MKLSITQPYFFPYLGFFQLIHATDTMIVLDTVQYKKRSWMNRNRILHPDPQIAFNYITLPVKNNHQGLIQDVEIDMTQPWKQKLVGQITCYANKAPFYDEVRHLFLHCLADDEPNYSIWSMHCIQNICHYLGLPFQYHYLSKLHLDLPTIREPDEWSLFIAEALKVTEYINMPKGVSIFNEKKFIEKNIKLSFLNPHLSPYAQRRATAFVSHLSIIDVLMWNSKERVLEMIRNDFDLLSFQEMHELSNTH